MIDEDSLKLLNRNHGFIAEIDEKDTHQIIVIGVAAITPHNALADSLMTFPSLWMRKLRQSS